MKNNLDITKVMKNYNKLFPIDGKVTDKQSNKEGE